MRGRGKVQGKIVGRVWEQADLAVVREMPGKNLSLVQLGRNVGSMFTSSSFARFVSDYVMDH